MWRERAQTELAARRLGIDTAEKDRQEVRIAEQDARIARLEKALEAAAPATDKKGAAKAA